ncbi:uncharacterized protein LOC102207246 [Pundamilia nyererei]|uniref:Uncharacterized protein LOC102207246 n=1 Tax=Pundamilia nyererei TaxID=303518 RepID=A0A9Y3REK4_9CICH|nr:PREDICTED: uncharacterized protein LOC102207246 [Pundamilia nyererei]
MPSPVSPRHTSSVGAEQLKAAPVLEEVGVMVWVGDLSCPLTLLPCQFVNYSLYSWKFHHTEPLVLEIWLTRLLSESSPCLTCLPSCPYTTSGPSPLRTAATHHQTHLNRTTSPSTLPSPTCTYVPNHQQLPMLSWTCPLAYPSPLAKTLMPHVSSFKSRTIVNVISVLVNKPLLNPFFNLRFGFSARGFDFWCSASGRFVTVGVLS